MCLDSWPINHDDGDLPAKINDHSTPLSDASSGLFSLNVKNPRAFTPSGGLITPTVATRGAGFFNKKSSATSKEFGNPFVDFG
jgi:hypothetical protein